MPMLSDRDRAAVEKRLQELQSPVHLVNFTQELECDFCKDTRTLLQEVTALSDQLDLQVFNFQIDTLERERYGIDKIQATAILGDRDLGIRFYGIPSGYEFVSLLDTMQMVSKGDSGLEKWTREQLARVDMPLHLEVFVTPT